MAQTEEVQRLLAELEHLKESVVNKISTLSQHQLNWKTNPQS